jgi:ligand-binding sensor domain-containing protein/DNA-binding CsgD family transcriptional regulator
MKHYYLKITRTLLILWCGSIFCLNIHAQSPMYGLPGIRNFPRSEFAGGIQSWSFTETDNGLLYFANNRGMLEYNGNTWTLYKSVRAVNRVVCADGNRIYVGAFNDFGYYEENERGTLQYHSLTHLILGKIGDFDEIWRIYKTSFGIVFQSFKAIFIYRDGKIQIVTPSSSFHLSYYVNGILWVHDEEQGLLRYFEGKLVQVPGGDFFIGTNIWSIMPLNDKEILIGTSNKGVFRYKGSSVIPWESKINEQFKKYQIYSAIRLKDNSFAFGTIQNGLIVTDTLGNLIFEMNKERGLQNNTVLGIGQDYKGNIWLCLDNGISTIQADSPISYFQNYFDIGTVYASAKFGDNIYLGTNQGLFYIRWDDYIDPSKSKTNFKLINGTEGQVWNLSVVDNTLLCGHNNGIFQVIGSQATKISSFPGAWNFLKIENTGFILVGSYTGLSVLENLNGEWKLRNKIKGFDESSRFVQKDQSGDIWVSQTYKGIFRLRCDSRWENALEVKLFNSKNGLPSDQSNILFKINSELIVATEKGIRMFNNKTQEFENDVKYSPYFDKGMQVRYLYQDSERNIWFYSGKQLGVLRVQEDGSYKKIIVPFENLDNITIPAFEHVNELDQYNVIIGIEGGFANYISKYNKNYALPCTIFISDLRSRDTTEGIYRFNSKNTKQITIPVFKYKNNTISITFASNNFEPTETEFQYELLGFDNKWSEWTTQKFKEYTNLPAGKYTFLLRAHNNDQTAPSEIAYKFIVLAPWYRSTVALIVYLCLFLLIVYSSQRYLSFRIEKSRLAEKQKQKEKYFLREHKLIEEALLAEKEMERLRNETLRLEMIHKEKELANSTMLLIKKNNLLNKLQANLRSVNSSLNNDQAKNSINSLIKWIDKEIDSEKQWKVFNMHIEEVYDELFKKLKKNYPDLTPRELSLCAYLRMNISSKEIATLMNISARGVEIGRYRIRKKLRLDREANLTEFMINI